MLENNIIECNCFLFDKKLAEMGVDSSDEKVRYSFLKTEVISVREIIEKSGEDTPADDKCCVNFKGGDSTWIDLSYEEAFEIIFGFKPKKV